MKADKTHIVLLKKIIMEGKSNSLTLQLKPV